MLRSLWEYRHFILASIRAELKGRFARSRLGGLWFLLNPLAQTLIFSIVLSQVLQARLPDTEVKAAYPIYLLSGLAAWTLFSEILNRSTTIFIEQASVIKKIAFPRLCLPVIVWGSALTGHVLLIAAILFVFLFFGHVPGWSVLALPLGITLISALAFGLGIILGVLNVFVRDIGQIVAIVLQLWFWLTPIVYPASIVPERFRWAVDLNPMAPLVRIYQDALLFGHWPQPLTLAVPALVAAGAVTFAFVLFRRASPELVDAL
ncbi:ABC transporter permease [Hyphomicrobium sp.]|uniref:ABC transporter permease n=1 Tax=Hyphomicrobium sp. TaxID=82 RepID=UPI002FE017A9